MPKYHISPKTGRANVCTASVQACPVGGQHFSSKEEAASFVEAQAAEEFSTVNTMAGAAKAPLWDELSEQDRLELTEILQERRQAKQASSALAAKINEELNKDKVTPTLMEDYLSDCFSGEAIQEKRGCSGCEEPYNDYCRCKYYTGQVESLPASSVANSLYSRLAHKAPTYFGTDRPAPEVLTELEKLVKTHNLQDGSIYTAYGMSDYYGESFYRMEVTDEGLERMEEFSTALRTLMDEKR